jgi:DNA-binding Xre family transcriptional regulator
VTVKPDWANVLSVLCQRVSADITLTPNPQSQISNRKSQISNFRPAAGQVGIRSGEDHDRDQGHPLVRTLAIAHNGNVAKDTLGVAMGRSIQVTDCGTRQLKRALRDRRWQQKDLILETGLSRQTISKLLNGRSVDWGTLQAACTALGVDITAIAITELAAPPTSPPPTASDAPGEAVSSLAHRIEQWRAALKTDLLRRCGTMRVLDMERPITLGSIYTQVNVLEKLTANQRCEVDELLDQLGDSTQIQGFDRLGLTRVRQTRVPGLTAVARNPALMVLGKPGAGKTTFLKYAAIACIQGQFLGDRVPIFVTLKEFADAPTQPSLLAAIAEQWAIRGIPAAATALTDCLEAGRALVLLDGLDEVRSACDDRVIHEIRQLAERYPKAAIVVTCRIAAKPYVFQRFVEVEIADFGDRQVREFITGIDRKPESPVISIRG